jgi:hypothetical protein
MVQFFIAVGFRLQEPRIFETVELQSDRIAAFSEFFGESAQVGAATRIQEEFKYEL